MLDKDSMVSRLFQNLDSKQPYTQVVLGCKYRIDTHGQLDCKSKNGRMGFKRNPNFVIATGKPAAPIRLLTNDIID